MTEKQELRAKLRTIRREYVFALPEAMRGLVFHRPPASLATLMPEGTLVGLYHATEFEAPTAAYARWFFENGRNLALPWFAERGSPMIFRSWDNPFDDDTLVVGPYGALQPAADAEEVVPAAAFVPLVGFTAEGHRLGQGGGHYDRWVGEHPGVRSIGLGWDCQQVDELPVEPHDRPLAAVVTQTQLYEGAA
ncbi:MAG TPA: 5-formyltetrahydrofolate cyclo-ligase [Novosphingobium sp.]|nr:5-formyltetrahydrofolate cyclo-ligase [Novosphingobium sp.]